MTAARIVDVKIAQHQSGHACRVLYTAGADPGRPSLIPGTNVLVTIAARGLPGPVVKAALDEAGIVGYELIEIDA